MGAYFSRVALRIGHLDSGMIRSMTALAFDTLKFAQT